MFAAFNRIWMARKSNNIGVRSRLRLKEKFQSFSGNGKTEQSRCIFLAINCYYLYVEFLSIVVERLIIANACAKFEASGDQLFQDFQADRVNMENAGIS